jgi:FdhD protein
MFISVLHTGKATDMSPNLSKEADRIPGGSTQTVRVWPFEGKPAYQEDQELIAEEPLSIYVEGKPYSVVMRTPGEENAHVAGFCLSEGIVDGMDDLAVLDYCTDTEGNVATVTLDSKRRHAVSQLLERRGFVSQTSCGICGKEMIEALQQALRPIPNAGQFTAGRIRACLQRLSERQKLYAKTRASHAAALFDAAPEMLAMSEDVGRHNALDKAIGTALINQDLAKACLGILSSRISYELVQKAARAEIPILVGMSRPTALAVQLATGLNMTLACDNKHGGLAVYCGLHRIVGAGTDPGAAHRGISP